MTVSMASGAVSASGNALDVAINGEGFFELGSEGVPLYTRNGQFSRADDGRLLGLGDRPVQGVGGGDIVLPEGDVTIAADGTISHSGEAIARIAIALIDPSKVQAVADGLLTAPASAITTADSPVLQQGFLESSNVSLGDEMVTLMEAVRRAETGQRLMNVYDDLMGRAITTFGQAN